MSFFKPLIKDLIDEGNTVDIATNGNISRIPACYQEWGCKIHQIDTSRSPLNKGNFNAIKQLRQLVDKECYEIVHCHTPVAAMCTRLACRKARKRGVKVIYTAHGFHFYRGAPLKNWLLYYPLEKVCARWTDILITINLEDYALAQKKLKAKQIEYVPGVGINVAKFADVVIDRDLKRDEIGVPRDAFLLLSVGELNENKNHETVIRALGEIKDSSIYYVIAGRGSKQNYLEKIGKDNGVNLLLLGFRNDIPELDKVADVYVLPSYREGLNVSVMEALASGLPIICGRIRGNVDLVGKQSGLLFDPSNISECAEAIKKIRTLDLVTMSIHNRAVAEKYEVTEINKQIKKIYRT